MADLELHSPIAAPSEAFVFDPALRPHISTKGVVLTTNLICHPYISDELGIKGALPHSSLLQRVMSDISSFDVANLGWLRDHMPLVVRDFYTDELVLLGTSLPTHQLVRYGTLKGEIDFSTINRSSVQRVINFQKDVAREVSLPLKQLDFYVEYGNVVFLDPSTVVMTTQVLDENPTLSAADIESSLSQFGVEKVLFIKPLEECGHSDMLVGVVDGQVYVPQITHNTIVGVNDDSVMKIFADELDVIANQLEAIGKMPIRLPIPITVFNDGRMLMMSPVNIAHHSNDYDQSILFAPIPSAKTIQSLTTQLGYGETCDVEVLIDSYRLQMKSILQRVHGNDMQIQWVECSLENQGGPHCMTASWPEELLRSPRDFLP